MFRATLVSFIFFLSLSKLNAEHLPANEFILKAKQAITIGNEQINHVGWWDILSYERGEDVPVYGNIDLTVKYKIEDGKPKVADFSFGSSISYPQYSGTDWLFKDGYRTKVLESLSFNDIAEIKISWLGNIVINVLPGHKFKQIVINYKTGTVSVKLIRSATEFKSYWKTRFGSVSKTSTDKQNCDKNLTGLATSAT